MTRVYAEHKKQIEDNAKEIELDYFVSEAYLLFFKVECVVFYFSFGSGYQHWYQYILTCDV
jgi:hypothetical protein